MIYLEIYIFVQSARMENANRDFSPGAVLRTSVLILLDSNDLFGYIYFVQSARMENANRDLKKLNSGVIATGKQHSV